MKNADKPVYPVHGGYDGDDPRNHTIGGGLTKREYFAAMAMQGILANPTETRENKSLLQAKLIDSSLETVCKQSIRYADELLKQLES
jgi:hypothetical protein